MSLEYQIMNVFSVSTIHQTLLFQPQFFVVSFCSRLYVPHHEKSIHQKDLKFVKITEEYAINQQGFSQGGTFLTVICPHNKKFSNNFQELFDIG